MGTAFSIKIYSYGSLRNKIWAIPSNEHCTSDISYNSCIKSKCILILNLSFIFSIFLIGYDDILAQSPQLRIAGKKRSKNNLDTYVILYLYLMVEATIIFLWKWLHVHSKYTSKIKFGIAHILFYCIYMVWWKLTSYAHLFWM